MLRSLVRVSLLALCSASALAQAPGFNCSKASTPREKAICSSPQLAAADSKMTAAYKALMAAATTDIQAEVRAGQTRWLHEDGSCKDPGGVTLSDCLLSAEQDRTKALEKRIAHHNDVTFLWREKYLTVPGTERQGYLDALWPEAQSSDPQWVVWNQAIAALVHRKAGNFDAHVKGTDKIADGWPIEWAADADTDISVTLIFVSENLVSSAVDVSVYTQGAAHGNDEIVEFNWLLKAQRELKSSDVFLDSTGWSKILYVRTDKYLHEKLDEDGQDYRDLLGKVETAKAVRRIVSDPEHWQIDKEGLVLNFNPYEVACYACTPDSFLMKWSTLKPLLNPVFQVPGS